jgi:hypothetical protein
MVDLNLYNCARGIRKPSAVVTTAIAATVQVLYQRTALGQNPRTVILRKIHAYNNVGATTLQIGTGLAGAWVLQYPIFRLANNLDNIWTEPEIIEVELGGDLTCQTDVAGVVIRVEVEEIGS